MRENIRGPIHDHHGWPNRPTWLMACWLSSHRTAYLGSVALAHWVPLRGEPHGSERARAAVAAKLERDVTANAGKITLFDNTTGETMAATPELLEDVDWLAIADSNLKRFEDYVGLP